MIGGKFYKEKLCSLDRKKGLEGKALVGAIYRVPCCKLKYFFWITNRRRKGNFSWLLLKKPTKLLKAHS